MRTTRPHRSPGAIAVLWLGALHPAMGQTAFPDHTVQDVTWTNGTHHIAVMPNIMSPGAPTQPVEISDDADAEFVSSTQVRLTDGFHAGDFSNGGQFRARIDAGLGTPPDLVLIAPDPAMAIVENVVHVPKWEKFEIGLRLPQDYQDAIASFFANYYSNGTDTAVTPAALDHDHDLNPYADDSLLLVITLTSPSNVEHMKWGFYMKEGKWSSSSDTARLKVDDLDPMQPYHVRFRFSPDEEGLWGFSIAIQAPHTETQSNTPLAVLTYSGHSFVCDPPLPDNHGFLHVNQVNKRVLQFDDGAPFFGMGPNMADCRGNPQDGIWYGFHRTHFNSMQTSMAQLGSAGGNFMRMWLFRHLFAPEWVNLGVYDAYSSPRACPSAITYTSNSQAECWAFDQMLDTARANNIYIQLCVEPTQVLGGETYIWGAHPYVLNFLEPTRNQVDTIFDVKRFFYSVDSNGTRLYDEGAFYYWKRKYKYIMARWGYSVNIAAFELLNEADQFLTYREHDLHIPQANSGLCPESEIVWPEDPEMRPTMNDWVTDIVTYAKDPVDPQSPATSPLGESDRLFVLSFTDTKPASDTAYHSPLRNAKLDMVDVHRYMWGGEEMLSSSFDANQDVRTSLTSIDAGEKRPVRSGESNYWAQRDYVDGGGNTITSFETGEVFSNCDVSFHNEIWSSTFYGNYAGASSWLWNRIFWWPHNALNRAPPDNADMFNQGNQWQQTFSNVLGSTNLLDVGVIGGFPVQNRTLYHHYKPLSDMLSNPDWLSYDFYGGNFTAHKIYDNVNDLECYYLKSADSTMAIGWVHNLNAYWQNQFYLKQNVQNFLGCTDPGAQSVSLTGFPLGANLHITYFPTRMDTTGLPLDQVDSTGTGTVTLDLSTDPLNGVLNNYLDTLHSDYAFIVALQPIAKGLIPGEYATTSDSDWDFLIYPNPTHDRLNVVLPSDGVSRNIAIYDATGRYIFSRPGVTARLMDLPTEGFARGAYCIRVSDAVSSRMKTLIIN